MRFREALRKARLYFVKNKVKSGSGYREYKRPLISVPMEISRVFRENTEFYVFYDESAIVLTKEENALPFHNSDHNSDTLFKEAFKVLVKVFLSLPEDILENLEIENKEVLVKAINRLKELGEL